MNLPQKTALKTHALQTLARVVCAFLPREAFGVRAALAPLWDGVSSTEHFASERA